MSTFADDVDDLVASAAEFGYTREQVMAWRRDDLIRFGDLLHARVVAEEAGLAVMREMYRERYGSDPA